MRGTLEHTSFSQPWKMQYTKDMKTELRQLPKTEIDHWETYMWERPKEYYRSNAELEQRTKEDRLVQGIFTR